MYVLARIAACVAATLPLTAFAQTIRHVPLILPHARLPVSRALVVAPHPAFRPIKVGPHTFYGTIVSLNGNSIVLRTRRNRLVNVDVTSVLAAGTYSAPLFVGKFVDVDGDQPATGAFVATDISRLTDLNKLANDH